MSGASSGKAHLSDAILVCLQLYSGTYRINGMPTIINSSQHYLKNKILHIGLSLLAVIFSHSGVVLADELSTPGRVVPPGLVRGLMTDDLKVLREVGANSCLLWGPPATVKAWDQFANAKQFVFVSGFSSPPKDFFEYENQKPVQMRQPYCYAGQWGQWWITNIVTAAKKNYPAAYCVTPDEMAWNNGVVPYLFGVKQPVGAHFYCDCEQCRQGAGNLPVITASRFLPDSEAARRYIRYRYQALAETLKESLAKAYEVNSTFFSYYMLNLHDVMSLERYPAGVALDRLPTADLLLATCFQNSVDCRGEESRFMQPMTVKHLLAARPRFGVVPCLTATAYDFRENFQWTESYYWRKEVEELLPESVRNAILPDLQPRPLRDDEVILPALSCLGNGARGVMFFGDNQRAALKQLFTVLATLEKRLAGASVPSEVVVLCSRQSEDEWMLSHPPVVGSRADLTDAMVQVGNWAQPADRIAWEFSHAAPHAAGFRASRAVLETLLRLGIPFRLQFIEKLMPDDLAEAKVVIIPFCTHLSDKQAAILRSASLHRKLIIFAHRGEFDENNKRRESPALAANIGITFFETEAETMLQDHKSQQQFRAAMGDIFRIRLECDSDTLERTWLALPRGGTAAFLINWSNSTTPVKVNLPGVTHATVLDSTGNAADITLPAVVGVAGRTANIILPLIH